jgi:hypothetical protein
MQDATPAHDDSTGLAELTAECWRLLRLAERLNRDQPPERQARGLAQLRYVRSRLDAILGARGLRLIAYDGEPYSPSLPLTVANADQLDGNEGLIVHETLEPTLVADGGVVAMGKVILTKGD